MPRGTLDRPVRVDRGRHRRHERLRSRGRRHADRRRRGARRRARTPCGSSPATGGRKPAPATEATLVNHPIGGPIFSGPQQQPFVCTTARGPLRRPAAPRPAAGRQPGQRRHPRGRRGPDGSYPQDGRGYPTADAQIVGWSDDCAADTRYGYVYRSTTDGRFHWLDDPAAPADRRATTTTMDGQTVPFVVRWERGTINRFIYSVAMLAPVGEADPTAPDDSLWNRRLVFSFQGGVGIGHHQGTTSDGRHAARRPARPGLRRDVVERHPHQHPLQPAGRRRDRAHAEGAHGRGPRRPRLHRGRGRLGRRHPAVRLRPEPPRAHRRRHRPVLVPRHGHPDHPRGRLRAARALLRRHRPRQPQVEGPGGPPGRHRAERHQLPEEPVAGRDRAVERALPAVRAVRLPGHGPRPGLARAGPHGVQARLVRAHPAGPQPHVHRRRRPRQAGPGHGGRRVDPLGRHPQHLRRRRRRLRPGAVGQRGRAVRAGGPEGGRHHAGRVPRPQRPGRRLEGDRRDGARGLPVRRAAVARELRPVELAQHEPEPRRRRHPGAAARATSRP